MADMLSQRLGIDSIYPLQDCVKYLVYPSTYSSTSSLVLVAASSSDGSCQDLATLCPSLTDHGLRDHMAGPRGPHILYTVYIDQRTPLPLRTMGFRCVSSNGDYFTCRNRHFGSLLAL